MTSSAPSEQAAVAAAERNNKESQEESPLLIPLEASAVETGPDFLTDLRPWQLKETVTGDDEQARPEEDSLLLLSHPPCTPCRSRAHSSDSYSTPLHSATWDTTATTTATTASSPYSDFTCHQPPAYQYYNPNNNNNNSSHSSTRNCRTSPPNSTAASSTTSGGGASQQPQRLRSGTNTAAGARLYNTLLQDVPEQQSGRLRASLDSGMAAMQRWIRARTTTTTTTTTSTTANNNNILSATVTTPSRRRSTFHSTSAPPQIQRCWAVDFDTDHSNHNDDQLDRSSRLDVWPSSHDEHENNDEELILSAQQFLQHRQRAQSEPDATRIQGYNLSYPQPNHMRQRRRQLRMRAFTEDPNTCTTGGSPTARQLSTVAAAALSSSSITSNTPSHNNNHNNNPTPSHHHSATATATGVANNNTPGGGDAPPTPMHLFSSPVAASPNQTGINNNNNAALPPSNNNNDADPERRARMRWIRINRRFQIVITIVALLFSLLLFSILVSWVVLTSVYVVSFDKSCDVPLKPYFWLVTLQLVLDVFRSDIMRFVFHWDANSNQRIPCRVICYNVAYLVYAMLVLRLGINTVFVDHGTCNKTAPELYRATATFLSLSIAAWATIIGGYLIPFCVVAAMLTVNGYNPSSDHHDRILGPGGAQPVFPAAYSTTGAPAGCIELIPIVSWDSFPAHYPRECCICMEEFGSQSVVVETACQHVFHKQCFREWLQQARSCPVCRTDIPSHYLDQQPHNTNNNLTGGAPPSTIPLGPTGRPVAGLLRMLHPTESSSESPLRSRSSSTVVDGAVAASPPDMEQGRVTSGGW